MTPVIDTAGGIGPAAIVWGSAEEVHARMTERETKWREQRESLLTYANAHPSERIRDLANETAEAINAASAALVYMFQVQFRFVQGANLHDAHQDAQARQDAAKKLAGELLEAIRSF